MCFCNKQQFKPKALHTCIHNLKIMFYCRNKENCCMSNCNMGSFLNSLVSLFFFFFNPMGPLLPAEAQRIAFSPPFTPNTDAKHHGNPASLVQCTFILQLNCYKIQGSPSILHFSHMDGLFLNSRDLKKRHTIYSILFVLKIFY